MVGSLGFSRGQGKWKQNATKVNAKNLSQVEALPPSQCRCMSDTLEDEPLGALRLRLAGQWWDAQHGREASCPAMRPAASTVLGMVIRSRNMQQHAAYLAPGSLASGDN